jgi:3-oxoacyl-[acyl-carrier protein] reductase
MAEKVAIITGSTRGIGREIAFALGRAGYAVVITGRRQEAVDATVSAATEADIEAIGSAVDVSQSDSAQALIDKALAHFGRIDVLVNNAGITADNLLMRMSQDEWDRVLNTNLKGAFNTIKAITRPLMKQRSGVIINISSVVGQMGNAGQVNYAAAKAGLFGLTKASARELASRNIRVNAIAPGFIQTDMTAALTSDQVASLQQQIPLNRLGEATDVAALTVFLASPDAAYITGQTINVDGGMVMT